MNRKNLFIILIAAVLIIIGVYSIYSKKSKNNNVENNVGAVKDITDRVIAKYDGGKEIHKSEIMKYITNVFNGRLPGEAQDFDELDERLQKSFIQNYAFTKLIDQEAKKSNISNTQSYKEKLEQCANDVMRREFLTQKTNEAVTDEKLQENYKKFTENWVNKEEVRASHILVATEEEAKSIERDLNKGKSFEELAQQKSQDTSKDKGGDLGYFTRGQMVKPFEDATFTLKVGQISKPVKTDFGWHIIKLIDKREVTKPDFEQVKPQLENEIKAEFMDSYSKKLLDNIEFIDKNK